MFTLSRREEHQCLPANLKICLLWEDPFPVVPSPPLYTILFPVTPQSYPVCECGLEFGSTVISLSPVARLCLSPLLSEVLRLLATTITISMVIVISIICLTQSHGFVAMSHSTYASPHLHAFSLYSRSTRTRAQSSCPPQR